MIKIPSLSEEQHLWRQGYKLVCGVDEVGRGSFAGPVVVGAVIFPINCQLIVGVADSKLLTAKQRADLESKIKGQSLCWAVAEVEVETINQLGIGRATQLAFKKAISLLKSKADFVLVDALTIREFDQSLQKAVIEGDTNCFSIAAASIIAKVHRDGLMVDLAKQHPEFGWDKNKGYGTKAHREAIKQYGLSKQHRRSFSLEKFL